MDTSPTTQMAEVLDEHWWPSSPTWKKFLRTWACLSLVWETVWRSSIGIRMGKSAKLIMSICSSITRIILIGICGRHRKRWKETAYCTNVEDSDEHVRFWTNRHHFSTSCSWDAANVNAKQTKNEQYKNVRVTFFFSSGSNWKNTRVGKNLMRKPLYGPTTWKDVLTHAWKDTSTWQTRRKSNFTKFSVLAWIINSRRKNWNQLETSLMLRTNCLGVLVSGTNG